MTRLFFLSLGLGVGTACIFRSPPPCRPDVETHLRDVLRVARGEVGEKAGSNDGDRPVMVAVVAVGMMEMAIDEVVDMVTVGDRRVTATRTVDVARIVARAAVAWRAVGRVRR